MRFEARGAPGWVAWCHCASCRRATGAPAAAYASFPVGAVRFTAAAPALFASSPGVERGSCGRCGSPVSYADPGRWPGEIHLHLGCLDDAAELAPTAEACAEERLPWVRLVLP